MTKRDYLKTAILNTFKYFADESLSDILVRELNNKDQKIRDEAIKALKTCGSREAIEPLYKLKNVFDPATRNLVHEAIAKIKARLGTTDMGALSIAEFSEKDGALSISADAEAGGLSIADGKDKEKKLSQDSGV